MILIQGAFFVLFGAAVSRYLRHRGSVELGVVAVFTTTAALFLLALLTSYAPGIATIARPITIAMLLAQPYLIVRLVDQIRPIPRWAHALALSGFVGVTAALLLLGTRNVGAILAVVVYFAVADTAAAVGFLRLAGRRRGAHRVRLVLAGLATACFGLAIVLSGLGSAANGGAGGGPVILVTGRVLALVAALGYLGAFLPPRWLTRFFHRAGAFDFGVVVVPSHSGGGPEPLWEQLRIAAESILGATDVRIEDAGDDVTGPGEDAMVLSPRSDRGYGTRKGSELRIPLVVDGRRTATLTARLEGQPLFVEDDIATVSLLGSFTARAVRHEADLQRLRETETALQESSALRASEARFRLFLEADPNAIIAADETGVIRWATMSSVALFARDISDLVGASLTSLVELPRPDDPALGHIEPDGVRRLDTLAFRPDGSTVPVEVALRRLEDDGIPMTVAVVSDSTWRQEANEIRDRFVGILSHELRTPITSIYGGAQVLLKRPTLAGATRHEILVGLVDESERLQRIIENLLILAKVERGADFFETRPVLIQRLVADVVTRERAVRPGATIRLDIAEAVPVVNGDDDQLVQVMRNLLGNAVKYAGDDAVIDVQVAFERPSVVVRVRDDGPGFPPDERDRLFTLYYRSPRSQAAPGAGIGLFVCRHLIEAMGGRIWAARSPSGGAEFGFALQPYVEPGDLEDAGTPARAVAPSTSTVSAA